MTRDVRSAIYLLFLRGREEGKEMLPRNDRVLRFEDDISV